MYHFFVSPDQIDKAGKTVTIVGTDVNHIKNVLRMKSGEEIAVSNGEDTNEYRCAIRSLNDDHIDCELRFIKEDNVQKLLSGSPLYMDPNLFEPNVDIKTIENEKVDIWAVGIFAYELFTGKRPFNSPAQSLKELIQI